MDYWLSFIAGFFGSMHCVGMCGAIVVAYSTQGISPEATRLSSLTAHLTYNCGRILSYVVLGGTFGWIGKGMSALQGVGHWFSLIIGCALVASSLMLLRIMPHLSFAGNVELVGNTENLLLRLYRSSFGLLVALPKLESKFYIGLITPLIPCGLLYSMFVKAAGTGSAPEGALIMLVFGLGIAPALILTGIAGSYLGHWMRIWGDKIAGATILLMGIVMILRAVGIDIHFIGFHDQPH